MRNRLWLAPPASAGKLLRELPCAVICYLHFGCDSRCHPPRSESGSPEDALALYREAVRLGDAEGNPQVETRLAGSRILLALGRFEEADGLIGRALKLAPDSGDANFERARLLLISGEAAAAAAEGETALRLTRGETPDRQLHYLLVRAYQKMGQEERAAEHSAALRSAETR